MNGKASAQTSAGSEDGQGRARLLRPSRGREHQDTQCVGWLP